MSSAATSAADTCATLRRVRTTLATELELAPVSARAAMVADFCEHCSGSLIAPGEGRGRASHMAELSLLGVTQFGTSVEAAIAAWMKSVLRIEQHIAEQEEAA